MARRRGSSLVSYAIDFFTHIVFRNPKWDFRTLAFDRDLAAADEAGRMLDATDPDSQAIRGPRRHAAVVRRLERSGHRTAQRCQLFPARARDGRRGGRRVGPPVHGSRHGACGRRNGTTTIDLLGTIDRWLESGTAPAGLDASRLSNGVVDCTRPLCPYPQVATCSGSGSTDAAASFICR
jgi:feruloyl esterase